MLTTEQIKARIKANDMSYELTDAIDELTWSVRIAIRESLGDIPMPRNLFYDYNAQRWID